MTDLIDIYKRNSKILIDNNHTIFASCLTQYAPEIIGAEKPEIKKRITIGGKQGTLWIYTEYGKDILYLNAYFQYRDSVGMNSSVSTTMALHTPRSDSFPSICCRIFFLSTTDSIWNLCILSTNGIPRVEVMVKIKNHIVVAVLRCLPVFLLLK